MLRRAYAYDSPSSDSSVRKADTGPEEEEEEEEEEDEDDEAVVAPVESAVWMRVEMTAKASAKGLKEF